MSFVSSLTRPLAKEQHHVLYTAKHMQIRGAIRQLIRREINPLVDDWEKAGLFPAHAVFKKLGSIGVFGVNKPTDYGGSDLNFSYSVAVAEELGSIRCGAIPMASSVQSDMATPALSLFGSDELKRQFLAPTVSGDLVSAIAVSEPHAGSDVAAIGTTAEWSGSDLIVNGEKTWITNGTQADWGCFLVNTNKHRSLHRNKSLVCIPLDSPGVHRKTAINKLGMRCSDTAHIYLDQVRVPSSFIIGEEGRGFVYQMMQFQDERLVTAAVVLEPLQRCIDLTLDYARNRRMFGGTLLDQQSVHFKLAELQTELEALRSLLYNTTLSRVNGEDVTLQASMAKLKAGRLCRIVTDSCLQIWGGVGFTWECEVSRMYRDFRLMSIGAGADEVMLSIIARHMSNESK